MQAIGIVGFSNSGKTTLVSRLSECLEAKGLRVAIAKYTHHELDKPDTDTALLMKPGRTIIGLSNLRTGGGEAMIHWGNPCDLTHLVPYLDADILLVEGGKTLGCHVSSVCVQHRNCWPRFPMVSMFFTLSLHWQVTGKIVCPACVPIVWKSWMLWLILSLNGLLCCRDWTAVPVVKKIVRPLLPASLPEKLPRKPARLWGAGWKWKSTDIPWG